MSLVSGSNVILDGSRAGAWFARQAVAQTGEPGVLALHRLAELALAPKSELPIARRPLRIPADAFVPVTARLLPPPAASLMLDKPRASATANDNVAPASPDKPRLARALRDALFLIVLAVTIYGAFHTGRQHAFHKIIEVPGPTSFWSEVT